MRTLLLLGTLSCGGLVSAGLPDASADGQVDCNVSATTFDTSCTTSSDCQVVWFGDVCSPACAQCVPNGAINVSSLPAYEAAVAALMPDGGDVSCACPISPLVSMCDQGTCKAIPHP